MQTRVIGRVDAVGTRAFPQQVRHHVSVTVQHSVDQGSLPQSICKRNQRKLVIQRQGKNNPGFTVLFDQQFCHLLQQPLPTTPSGFQDIKPRGRLPALKYLLGWWGPHFRATVWPSPVRRGPLQEWWASFCLYPSSAVHSHLLRSPTELWHIPVCRTQKWQTLSPSKINWLRSGRHYFTSALGDKISNM